MHSRKHRTELSILERSLPSSFELIIGFKVEAQHLDQHKLSKMLHA